MLTLHKDSCSIQYSWLIFGRHYKFTMRRHFLFIIFLAALSTLSGWLMSHMSWIGRVGINLIHKEYKFLKVWYKGAGVVFGSLLVLYIVQLLVQKRLPVATRRVAHIIALLVAIVGLYFTYNDFRSDISHGLLKERFHLGAYLFWIGWMSISIFFFTEKQHPDGNKAL
jgi:hypothetical protein